MSFLRNITKGLRSLFRKEQVAQELDEELRTYQEMATEEKIRDGMSRKEALRAVRLERGSPEVSKEIVRSGGWESFVETCWQDLRYGLRMLRKSPGFTVVAVLTLALGIGANTAIFNLIDGLLLKSLPVQDPQSLLFLAKEWEGRVAPAFYFETFQRLREEQPFFLELAAYSSGQRMNVSLGGTSEPTSGQLVSGNYYAVLGVPPVAGRLFTPDDDRVPGGQPVAVISYGYWLRHFGAAPSAIGANVLIDGTPFTIVGVTPPGFFGLQVGDAPEISVPIMMQPQVMPDKESWLGRPRNTVDWLTIFGRLRPGVTAPQATSGLQVIFHNIQTQLAAEIGLEKASWRREWVENKLVLLPGGAGLSGLRREYATALLLLMGVVGLVLLIACANVGNMLLVRATARRKEIAVRLAIGASRARLIRQLLVESTMLSALGGALGIGLSYWLSELLVRLLSASGTPIRLDLSPDWRVLAFTASISVVTGMLFGLAPALRGASLDLTPALNQEGRGAGTPQGFARALSVAQLALSLVLLSGAGLLASTLHHLDSVDGRFPRNRVYTVSLSPRGSDQKNGANGVRLNRIYLDLLERVRGIPGVAAASLAGEPPVMRGYARPYVTSDGLQFRAAQNQIYPGYFAALGSPIVQGRDFGPADTAEGAPLVTIVDETLARRVFPGQNPIGKRIVCSGNIAMGERGNACEVIGVARDIPYPSLKSEPQNMLYMTFLQCPTGRGQMELIVRTTGDRTNMAARIRQEVAAVDPYAFEVRTLANEVDAVLIRERLLAFLSTAFSGFAALLAAIGLYGVIAYSVGRRTKEIAVRMALGAAPGQVMRQVLRETLTLVALGIFCGVPMALAGTRLLAGFLYGVKPGDPIVFGASIALLVATAGAAGLIPARRATRIDPLVALRYE